MRRKNLQTNPRKLTFLLVGYVVLMLGTLPVALPLWKQFGQDSIGRVVTVEQIHLAQYFVLGFLACLWALGNRWKGPQLLLLLGGACLIGIVDEWIQSLLPSRYFQWSDVGLNGVGSSVGLVLGWLIRPHLTNP